MSYPDLISIGELEKKGAIIEIQDGNHGEKHPKSGDYVITGVPFIMANNLDDGRVDLFGCKFISKEQADSLRIGFARTGDVLLSHKGTVGRVAVVPSRSDYIMLTPQVTYYRVDPNKLCNTYLAYAFREPGFQARLKSISMQSTRPYVGITMQRDLSVLIHPLINQQKIASILSAYDDLIENNLQRIKLLEEMARALYREWFIKFRFPGYEKARMVDSPMGKIPEGWEISKVGDLASLHRGRSYRSKDLVEEGGLPFVNLKCVNRDGGFRSDGLKRYIGPYKDTQLVGSGDIIIAVTDMTQERRIVARAARISKLEAPYAVFSMDLVKVCPKEYIPIIFLYAMLRFSSFSEEIKQYANGVNVLHLSPDRISEFTLPLPPQDLREQYSLTANAIYLQRDVLRQKNHIFRRTRDLLIPKLISGELEVSELDIAVPEEVA